MDDFEVMHLPPIYSEADIAARDDVTDRLIILQREYQDLRAPLLKRLMDINARYAPRVVLIPKPLKEELK